MRKSKDLSGEIFGKLTVVEKDKERTRISLENRRKDKTKRNKIYWICKCECGNIISVDEQALKQGNTKTCRKCPKGESILVNHSELLEEWDFNKNTYNLSNVTIGSHDKFWWKCDNGHSYQCRVSNKIHENSKCPYCSNRKVLKGYNDLNTVRPDLIQYLCEKNDGEKVTQFSHKKIKTKCPICKETKEMTVAQLSMTNKSRKYPCNCCSVSYSFPELFMYNVLCQLNIKFCCQKRFDWNKNSFYDFYIEDKNIIIETHGQQHYEQHGFSDFGKITLEQQQQIDQVKEEKAKAQNIKYIIIDCRKSNGNWIQQSIENSELNQIYDLSKVKWKKCSIMIPIIQSISEKWNEGMNVTEMIEYFNKDRTTILKYLKIGAYSNLCDYDVSKSFKRKRK